MEYGSLAPLAILLNLQFLGLLLLVHGRRIVTALALSAGQSHNVSHEHNSLS